MPDYHLSWRAPNERLYDIALRFTAPEDDPLLWLPAWRPGRYLIMNFAANVREWSANLRKVGKSSWRVSARKGEQVEVTYRYYAGVLDAGSSFLAEDEAYVNGSNLFMCVDAVRHEPCTLHIDTDWPIESQLPGLNARDYDHLIDSPIIASPNMTVHSFDESGATIHLVFRHMRNTGQFIEPVKMIVHEQAALFGGLPLRDYRFLYHAGDRWHGVEHEGSCSIIVKRAAEGTDHFLSITSHELFHLWNVKRILPAAFVPYDYSRETPTKLLWAMEGITSYFGDLVLARCGIWSEAHYLEHLQHEIELLENSPGRNVLSLSQASFDGWLHDQMHDRANAWISFYNKGEIVAALLDVELRKRGRSLDEIMQTLWRDYGQTGRGVEEDGLERIVGLPEFFAKYVDGLEPLPYEEVLAAAGIAFVSRPRSASLGAKVKVSDGALLIESVTRGGAAMAAGLLPNDEVIAIDGTRTRHASEANRAMTAAGEREVEVVFARGGVVDRCMLTPRADGSVDIELKIAEPDNALRREWLRSIDDRVH
ncbi:MAG TPA: PDZ domain-containing protein [Thermoanaerobaculia bacterium]|nr:PDZ domain-containing protein [Thermoanaerobaculia bacterium]